MSEYLRQHRPISRGRAQRGQTLIVAIAVLFLLFFIGGVFVAQIARNLVSSGRSRETQDALALAEAGIRYCDAQLTNGEEGADWRPVPTPSITSTQDPDGLRDPDYEWLITGFTRIPMKGGRALVRVSYDPTVSDPRSQLLKIESIGRPGELGNGLEADPTVFAQNGPSPRLRKELVAYKQIGLTDYLRWCTGKDQKSADNYLGTPGIGPYLATILGDPSIGGHPDGLNGNSLLFGAPIRVNGDLTLGGDLFLYESPRGNANQPTLSVESLLVSGRIKLAPTREQNGRLDDSVLQGFVNTDPTADPPNQNSAIRASADPNFDTHSGVVRDGAPNGDKNGYARDVPNLDPPVIDGYTNGSGVLRYRAGTRDSGQWKTDANGNLYNTGQFGWGRGIYIDNPQDRQIETTISGINGSYSQRADWLNPNNSFAQSYWKGPFYVPPGVQIDLLGDYIRLTRNDDGLFTYPDGQPSSLKGGKAIVIPLSDIDRQNFRLPDGTLFPLAPLDHDGDDSGNHPFQDRTSYGVNVVLMAEGNVRVRGVFGAVTDPAQNGESINNGVSVRKLGRVHLTIVSGATAYLEGNVVKGDGILQNGARVLEHGSTCAVLARDYVCVNPTLFMAPQNQTNVWNRQSPDLESFNTEIGMNRQTYDAALGFGIDPAYYTTTAAAAPNLYLMVRHAALSPGPAFLNLAINPALGQILTEGNVDFNTAWYGFRTKNDVDRYLYALGLKPVGGVVSVDSAAITPNFESRALALRGIQTGAYFQGDAVNGGSFFPTLLGLGGPRTNLTPGYDNFFRVQLDPTQHVGYGFGGSTDYLLGGMMVTPLDIRIEALLYAQEKSFFIIPGYGINPDPNDTREAFEARGRVRTAYSRSLDGTVIDSAEERLAKDVFPFFNEPLDVRITIYGAVAENHTASMGDQAAWLKKWGWYPEIMGSTYIYDGTSGINRVRVPDLHRFSHDPAEYNPGQDRTVDYRTPYEKGLKGPKDLAIGRGLRFLYDPAFAMPYRDPTRRALYTGASDTRRKEALRYVVRQVKDPNDPTKILGTFRQTLPPIPRLPVCKGLLYFGDGESAILQ